MKKNKLIYFIASLFILTTACEDLGFIEPVPEDRLTEEIALADLSGVSAVLSRGYNRMVNFNYYGRVMFLEPDALADNLEPASTNDLRGEIFNIVRSHISIWTGGGNFSVRGGYNAYSTINDANIVIEKATEFRDEDSSTADLLVGEALFIRALSYFDLLRVYAYVPGNEVGGMTMGVPISPGANFGTSTISELERAPASEGFALVEADLTRALTLLPASSIGRASQASVRALQARLFLYLGRYADAVTAAEAAMSTTGATLTDAAGYVASWSATNHPEAIWELDVQSQDWNGVDGVNNSLATYTNTDAFNTNARGSVKATDEMLAAYEAGDVRSTLWIESTADFFESRKWPGELGDFRENLPVFRYSEMLLTAAEGKARTGNEAGALTDINRLRTNRGLAASTASGAALIDLILNERRVELVMEGHRFFDLKRLGMDIPKPADTGLAPVSFTDFRILAPLSNQALGNNLALEQNPGY